MTRASCQHEQSHPSQKPIPDQRTRFRALTYRNFRLYLLGQVVMTSGLWVQRIAQDWLVLSLTASATAVGITTALQWAPMLVFGLVGGWIADHYPKRRVLLVTQSTAALLAATLATLTLTHHVAAWHIQLLAAGLGTVTAIDQPTRQAFVTELVGIDQIHSAISLNNAVFYAGSIVGPAISGALITAIGPGWAFGLNSLTYTVALIAVARIRVHERTELAPTKMTTAAEHSGLGKLARQERIWRPIAMGAAFGMFSFNLPVTLSAYARSVHSGPAGYALLTTSVAIGSLFGALIAAGRVHITLRGLTSTGWALAGLYVSAAAMPTQLSLGCVLIIVGAATTLFFTAANATVQLAAGPAHRGRALSVYLLVIYGSGALGGPLLGIIAQHLSPRLGLLVTGVTPAVGLTLIALARFASHRGRTKLLPSG